MKSNLNLFYDFLNYTYCVVIKVDYPATVSIRRLKLHLLLEEPTIKNSKFWCC